MIKIYHNPRCSKSRAGLKYLQDQNLDIQIIEYLKTPIGEAELEDILVRLHKKPVDIIRTHEDLYKKQFKGKAYNDHEWVKILLENPKLIHRPIVVNGPKAVIGNPAEEIAKIL